MSSLFRFPLVIAVALAGFWLRSVEQSGLLAIHSDLVQTNPRSSPATPSTYSQLKSISFLPHAHFAKQRPNRPSLVVCLPEQQARRFVEHIDARRRQRHSCAITFQRAVRRFAARREAYLHRVSRREHAAARKLQSSVRLWLSGRQARQRTLLRQMGACALCCKRLAAVFFDATEQVDHKGGNKPWRRRKSGGWGSSILSAEGFREW